MQILTRTNFGFFAVLALMVHPNSVDAEPGAGREVGDELIDKNWCPSKPVEWRYFRDVYSFGGSKLSGDPVLALERFSHIERCFDGAKQIDPLVLSCFSRFRGYLKQITSKDPLEALEYTEIPKELLDPKIIKDLRTASSIPRAVAQLRALNSKRPKDQQLIVLPFKGTIPAIDGSQSLRRVLVYYPGQVNKWISFSVPQEGSFVEAANVSVVAVVKKSDTKKAHQTYFQDRQVFFSNGEVTLSLVDSRRMNCLACHSMGVNPIRPELAGPGEEKTIDHLLHLAGQGSTTDFGSGINREFLGPGLGPVRERSEAFLRECASRVKADSSAESLKRVSEAMNCSSCHNDRRVNRLTVPWAAQTNALYKVISSGAMPKHEDLTPSERYLLAACLESEFVSDFAAWIKAGDCGAGNKDYAVYLVQKANKNLKVIQEGSLSSSSAEFQDLIKKLDEQKQILIEKTSGQKKPNAH